MANLLIFVITQPTFGTVAVQGSWIYLIWGNAPFFAYAQGMDGKNYKSIICIDIWFLDIIFGLKRVLKKHMIARFIFHGVWARRRQVAPLLYHEETHG